MRRPHRRIFVLKVIKPSVKVRFCVEVLPRGFEGVGASQSHQRFPNCFVINAWSLIGSPFSRPFGH